MPFLLRPDPLEEFTALTESAFPKVIKMLSGGLVYVGKALTNLQILGRELPKMRLAAGLRLDPLGKVQRFPRPPSRYKRKRMLKSMH